MSSIASPYPATDPGFAALDVAALLDSHHDLLARIRMCFGIDSSAFDADVTPLIRSYAECVHLVPATPDNYFKDPGGLLELGLQVAFYSLQGTDAHIFSGQATISVRRQLEPKWRLATFAGGLCCELHRLLSHLVVVDEAGKEWPGYIEPLGSWLVNGGIRRYYVRWKPRAIESRGLGLMILPQVLPRTLLHYLGDGNSVVVPHMMASIGGVSTYSDRNVLDGLVRRSLALVIDRNLHTDAARYGAPQYGSHLERYLVDAMRRLVVDDPAWLPNDEKTRVWFGRDGLYLVWPGAAADIVALLDADQLVGIPKAPDTILEILAAANVLTPRERDTYLWSIHPPGSRAPIDAVKLSSPAILLAGGGDSPHPLRDVLATHGDDRPAASRAVPTRDTQLSLLSAAASPTARPATRTAPVPPVAVPDSEDLAVESTQQEPCDAPALSLRAPMRLNPAVRDILAEIIERFGSGDGMSTARAIATGLHIPFAEFEARGVQAAIAARALTEGKMLAGPSTDGLVVAPLFITGLDQQRGTQSSGPEATC